MRCGEPSFGTVRGVGKAVSIYERTGKLLLLAQGRARGASDSSFQVRWLERVFEGGALKDARRLTGLFSIVLTPPRTVDPRSYS